MKKEYIMLLLITKIQHTIIISCLKLKENFPEKLTFYKYFNVFYIMDNA